MTWFTSLTFAWVASRNRQITPAFPGRGRQLAALFQHFVDQPVAYRLVPVHESVAVGILLDALDALAGVLGQDLVSRSRVSSISRAWISMSAACP